MLTFIMADDPSTPPPPDSPRGDQPPAPHGPPSGGEGQHVQYSQVGARVPERVSRGTFATGLIVLSGQSEFVLDFVLRLSRPHTLAARVVVPVAAMPGFIGALRENLARYTARFGPPPPMPKPDPALRPSIQDVYDDLKIADDMLCGVYAHGLLIGHSPTEFCLDFLTNFYPLSAVSCRVFVASPNVPTIIDSLVSSYEQYRRRLENPPPPPAPPSPPEP
jgi:hypothetical protein